MESLMPQWSGQTLSSNQFQESILNLILMDQNRTKVGVPTAPKETGTESSLKLTWRLLIGLKPNPIKT